MPKESGHGQITTKLKNYEQSKKGNSRNGLIRAIKLFQRVEWNSLVRHPIFADRSLFCTEYMCY